MHETATSERDHLRLQRPPVRERLRPLARAAHLVHLLAREDDAAVDHPGDDRRELLGGDGHHALVEQGETFSYPSILHQHVALSVDREREEVAVAEALADANRFACGCGCGCEVPGRLVLEHRRQEQVAALGAVAFVLEKPLCAAQPARCRADLATGREVQADPHRTSDAAQRLPALEVERMRPLEPRDRLVVAAEHEGGGREQLEVLRGKRCDLVRSRQRLVRLEPRPLGVGLTASPECGHFLHPRHFRSGRSRRACIGACCVANIDDLSIGPTSSAHSPERTRNASWFDSAW